MRREASIKSNVIRREFAAPLHRDMKVTALLEMSHGSEHRAELLRLEEIIEELRTREFVLGHHHGIGQSRPEWSSQRQSPDRIYPVEMGDVTLVIDRVGLGSHGPDILDTWARGAQHDGRRVIDLPHEA